MQISLSIEVGGAPDLVVSRLCVALLIVFAVLSAPAGQAAGIDQLLAELIDEHELDGDPDGVVKVHPAAPLPKLGRALFFSKQLSGDRDVACASCHHPLLGGGDALSLPVGIGAHRPEIVGPGRLADISLEVDPKAVTVGGPNVRRNSLSTFNVSLFQRALLFDGRVSLMEARGENDEPLYRTPESTLRSSPDGKAVGDLVAVQARFPVVSFQEMRGFGEFYELTAAEVRRRIAERLREHPGWVDAFRLAFRDQAAKAEDVVTFDNIAAALSAFQQTQTFVETPWRDYVRGNQQSLTETQKAGARLFFSSVEDGGYGCASCHSGDFFTDERLHASGFPQLGRGKRADGDDPGGFLVLQNKDDLYRFRTPSLLNVSVTGPWGHSGAFDSLESVVRYHANPRQGLDEFDFSLSHLRQLAAAGDAYAASRALTEKAVAVASEQLPHRTPSDEEVGQLVAFMESLTDPCVESRECLQPWIANYTDDFDGHLLQPIFDPSAAPLPFHVIEDMAVAEMAASVALPASVPAVSSEVIADLVACYSHTPERPVSGESAFTDVTAASGIDHRHFIPGEMWYGSRYSFTVEFAMHSGPMASGDLNGDCLPDLIYGTHNGESPVAIAYLNKGNGFERHDLELEGMPDAIGAFGLADLDGDYQLDLAVGNLFGARETALYRGGDEAQFDLAQKVSMSKVVFGFAFADYSGDGWLDLFAAHWDVEARPAQAPALMKNDGGKMRPADREAGTTGADLEQNFHFSPGFADFDADGHVDLVIASDFDTTEALRNTGRGSFEVVTDREVISDENGMGLAIADFNNDGNLDWFITAIYREEDDGVFEWGETGNRIYLGTGEGMTFVDATRGSGIREGDWGWGACAADFNNDGWIDIFHENGYGSVPEYAEPHIPAYLYQLMPASLAPFHQSRPRLFLNQGDGTFLESGRDWGLTEETNGRGIVCLDYDRDGDIDIATAQNADTPRVYENHFRGSEADGFVGFHLIGTQPNTSAIGATVSIEVLDNKQMRPVTANSNFQGQNPATVHFGLGAATSVDRVTIRWPDGRVETLKDVEGNRYYPLLHPDLRESAPMVAGREAP